MTGFSRERAISFLLRRPGARQARVVRAAVLVLAATGAGFLVWSAVIHLELWADGYRDIGVIGPLFLAQGIACIVLAAAVVTFRWLVLLAAGAVAGAATAAGLLLSANVGLFGYTESLAVPYATLSLAVEFTAAFVLLAAATLLALAAPVGTADAAAPVGTADAAATVGTADAAAPVPAWRNLVLLALPQGPVSRQRRKEQGSR